MREESEKSCRDLPLFLLEIREVRLNLVVVVVFSFDIVIYAGNFLAVGYGQ